MDVDAVAALAYVGGTLDLVGADLLSLRGLRT
jgi:hypothetical protein